MCVCVSRYLAAWVALMGDEKWGEDSGRKGRMAALDEQEREKVV